MRKKQILALLAMILFGASAFVVFKMNQGPAWPLAAVDATFRKTVAADPEIQIDSMVRTSGDIHGNRHPLLNQLSHALRHRPLYPDTDEYFFHNRTEAGWLYIHHSGDFVNSVEIRLPAKSPSTKLAERLRSDLLAAHPGLRCSIKKL